MQKIYLLLIVLICFTCTLHAQYEVKSINILQPEVNIDHVKSSVKFWIDHAYDPIKGGFYSNIDRQGKKVQLTNVRSPYQKYYRKSFVAQTRQGYGFTRAFMLTGDENYLMYAKSALDFLFQYGWDATNEGWYYFAKEDGSLDGDQWWNPNLTKVGFQQHYALVGIVANYEATRNSVVKSWMDKGFDVLNNKMWDTRTGYEGYFENTANATWATKSGKGFTCTVDAITTNAELSYLVTQEEAKKERLLQLGNIIVKRFIPQMDNALVKVLYPESFTTDWAVSSYTADASVGHFLKTAWVLGRAYLCDTTKKEFKNAAIKILDKAWSYDNGNGVTIWDKVNGGPFNNLKVSTGGWGSNGDSKDYWTLEQGFTGPMINYYITKNPLYLQMADDAISFYMSHFTDNTYGETYSLLDKTGNEIVTGNKGDDFKANYHNVEFAYYAYLYSSLYYLHQPATLYYKFEPADNEQIITLTPIPMENGLLRIKSVTLDGANFTNFDAVNRTLTIAANQGGKFKVTYESFSNAPNAITEISDNIQIYPNPTVDYVQIKGIAGSMNISLLDITGKLLYSESAFENAVNRINMNDYKPGIYFVAIQLVNGRKVTKKIVKL